jgi:hypothetical protein
VIYKLFNYRHALEIVGSARWQTSLAEITDAITKSPVFLYPGKAPRHPEFDVVQQVQNTYFDRRFAVDYGWEYHPSATGIADSKLAADFRKKFRAADDELSLQAEVQFGNMSRWYSDVFKFQAAYSADLIHIGVSIVPTAAFAKRIGDNIVSFERCQKELPAAKLSITHPILLFGIEPDASTIVYDLSRTRLGLPREISGRGKTDIRFRIVNAFINGIPESELDRHYPTGPLPAHWEAEQDEQDDEDTE